jgi:hypothetical protein
VVSRRETAWDDAGNDGTKIKKLKELKKSKKMNKNLIKIDGF